MNSTNKDYFHFTLGPVQGFVAQARRTRDFWAGSFILSWLSAVAMRTVQKQGGVILFPEPDAAFMKALEEGETGPSQGNIPNRFKAKVSEAFKPEEVVAAVRQAWIALADWVYKNDLAELNLGGKTKGIWDQQIENFWEMSWALTEDENDSGIIDRLKNWRTHLPPDEPGVKCMMMEGWQELSGLPAPNRKDLKSFWDKVRNNGKTGMTTDLRENEQLCAIALVKRRFARHFVDFPAQEMPCGWTLKGWKLPSSVPSVHYMAAAPWLAKLIKKANDDPKLFQGVWEFHNLAETLTGHSEWGSNIRCVHEAITAKSGQKEWAALDGTVFFDAMLENPNLWDQAQQVLADKVLAKLKVVRQLAQIEPVSPFYAVLLMDGDQLGIHMSDAEKQEKITASLAEFTGKVDEIVKAHNGFLIYAGGDDVLALLPLEDALGCAAALRLHYLKCFDLELIPTSLSGAIEYAHIKMPLGKVLHDSHDLLDNLAKDGRGRDAIACRVWKPGGLSVEWAMPWECALEPDGKSLTLERLADKFRPTAQPGEDTDRFASKFFYRIREHFSLLNPEECRFCRETEPQPESGTTKPLLTSDQAISLMAAEYLNSGAARVKTMAEAKAIIEPLLEQCRPVIQDFDHRKDKKNWPKSTCLKADGALLVRFLAHKGVER